MNTYEKIRTNKHNLVWTELSLNTWEDSPRDLQYYKCVATNTHIMLIGGVSEEHSTSRGYDSIPTLSVSKRESVRSRKWEFKRATGDIPPTRYGHTATLVGNKVFVFGGRDPRSTRSFGDFYALDIDLMEWKRVEGCVDPPSPRYDHTATFVANKLYIIGGTNSHAKAFPTSVGCFNLDTMSWEQGLSSSSQSVKVSGHIAIPYNSNTNPYILVLGSTTKSGQSSKAPQESPQSVFLQFKLDSGTWDNVEPPTLSSTPMRHHAAAWRTTKNGVQVFIHGGFNDSSDVNSRMVLLVIGENGVISWAQLQGKYDGVLETPALRNHNMLIVDGSLYLLGGMKGLGKQPSPFWCGCVPCVDTVNYTSIFRIELPDE